MTYVEEFGTAKYCNKILWTDETFLDEIEKIGQEADEGSEDDAIGSNVESDDENEI